LCIFGLVSLGVLNKKIGNVVEGAIFKKHDFFKYPNYIIFMIFPLKSHMNRRLKAFPFPEP
jgi:hypothetical protein